MIPLELKFRFIFQFFGVIFPDDILSFVFCSGSGKGNFVSGIPQRKFPYGKKEGTVPKRGAMLFGLHAALSDVPKPCVFSEYFL